MTQFFMVFSAGTPWRFFEGGPDLTQYGRYLMPLEKGGTPCQEHIPLSVGVPASDGRAGSVGSHAKPVGHNSGRRACLSGPRCVQGQSLPTPGKGAQASTRSVPRQAVTYTCPKGAGTRANSGRAQQRALPGCRTPARYWHNCWMKARICALGTLCIVSSRPTTPRPGA